MIKIWAFLDRFSEFYLCKTQEGYCLSQRHYILTVLKRFGMSSCKAMSTTMSGSALKYIAESESPAAEKHIRNYLDPFCFCLREPVLTIRPRENLASLFVKSKLSTMYCTQNESFATSAEPKTMPSRFFDPMGQYSEHTAMKTGPATVQISIQLLEHLFNWEELL